MNLEKNISQMRKGVLEMCILSVVSEKPAYASDILDELKKARLIVVEGTLYPLLTRLKNAGFLDYHWEESRTGPPRKYYRITPLGSRLNEKLHSSWNELARSVDSIINKVNPSNNQS